MSVRFGRIAIKRPAACSDKAAPAQIELHVVEVREQPHSVVGKEAPVHWRLLTTHPVACVEDALQCVDWYRQCWHIEQLFRTLKKQGLDVESSQVETGAGLAKLACLALQAAVRTLQLTLARDGANAVQAGAVFEAQEAAAPGADTAQSGGENAEAEKPPPPRLARPCGLDRCPPGRLDGLCV